MLYKKLNLIQLSHIKVDNLTEKCLLFYRLAESWDLTDNLKPLSSPASIDKWKTLIDTCQKIYTRNRMGNKIDDFTASIWCCNTMEIVY
jgi:hypothetical protein